MFDPGKCAAAVGAAALVIALGGCAGAAGTAESYELHQERARPASKPQAQATDLQGQRLAEYAEARAAGGDVAADAQGRRLAGYAEASAAAGVVAADTQGHRLAEYAAALAASDTGE